MSHRLPALRPNRASTWIGVITGILLCGLSISLIFVPYWLLQSKFHTAQQKWEQFQPSHFQYEAVWQGVLLEVEIQDHQLIRVVDLSTHQTPEPSFWSHAKDFVLVDELFHRIDTLFLGPKPSIDDYLSMTYPEIVDRMASYGFPINAWVNRCVYPLPTIHYNRQWGYPEYLRFRGHQCIARTSGTPLLEEELIISHFQLLP